MFKEVALVNNCAALWGLRLPGKRRSDMVCVHKKNEPVENRKPESQQKQPSLTECSFSFLCSTSAYHNLFKNNSFFILFLLVVYFLRKKQTSSETAQPNVLNLKDNNKTTSKGSVFLILTQVRAKVENR